MKKSFRHIITSWVAVVSFTVYSLAIPSFAYANDEPNDSKATVALPSCEILGIPSLNLTLPSIGAEGDVYDVGSRYRIYDTSTNRQLNLKGTFLTRPAAASLLVGLQNIESTWQIELNRVLSYNNSCWQYRLSLAQSEIKLRDAKIVSLTSEMERRIQIRDEHIELLNKNNYPPRWYESNEFWLAVGVIAGIGITVGAGYAIGQANN